MSNVSRAETSTLSGIPDEQLLHEAATTVGGQERHVDPRVNGILREDYKRSNMLLKDASIPRAERAQILSQAAVADQAALASTRQTQSST